LITKARLQNSIILTKHWECIYSSKCKAEENQQSTPHIVASSFSVCQVSSSIQFSKLICVKLRSKCIYSIFTSFLYSKQTFTFHGFLEISIFFSFCMKKVGKCKGLSKIFTHNTLNLHMNNFSQFLKY
jgi:hypothetical protein